jgi:hypothetical protein
MLNAIQTVKLSLFPFSFLIFISLFPAVEQEKRDIESSLVQHDSTSYIATSNQKPV